jgi:DNA-binding response OmpR family regulator
VQYDADCYRYRGLQVAFSACRVEVDGTSVRLSPKEFELLEYLIRNRNMALSRSQLLQAVWGEDYYGDARTLDTHIKKLRQALGAYGRMIVTVRGIGYRLDAE